MLAAIHIIVALWLVPDSINFALGKPTM